ncbi:glycosyltransferase family 2 protein [Flavobacterium sp. FlaQc-48]|uniref:glycosyltransferase family 2 protein n=1 Tax=Flavobacterium sp. FlaQc-48 TaxID=3374181 RepID=UPI0037576359
MIVIYHHNNKVVEAVSEKENLNFSTNNVLNVLVEIAVCNPNELLVWCHYDLKSNLNLSEIHDVFHHKKIMASYNPFANFLLSDAIGYVEESPFIKVNKKVTYPTWQMSSCAGGLHASVLLELKNSIPTSDNFEYFLHSIAKLAMDNGLFCYSEPLLLRGFFDETQIRKNNKYVLFQFVKQHYKAHWVFLLFLNLFLYERKLAFLPLVFSLFYSKRNLKKEVLSTIEVKSSKKTIETEDIDVIIPTIGRKDFLYDILKDFSLQTHLPKKIIIIEQNPNLESVSELNYLRNESWPFEIKHIFTHQAGACNARNLGLAETKNEWVFMADDDIRINNSFLKEAFIKIRKFGLQEITFACYEGDYDRNKKYLKEIQWEIFGSGCSIVKHKFLENLTYRKGFEFGYGEDTDFGMQLRNAGLDIIYIPKPEILHLKAPVGGFRTKPVLQWQDDVIQPKPSPTVMLYKILNLSKEQMKGYKTTLLIKFYKSQSIKNPIRYLLYFNKQWNQSMYWANQLKNKV